MARLPFSRLLGLAQSSRMPYSPPVTRSRHRKLASQAPADQAPNLDTTASGSSQQVVSHLSSPQKETPLPQPSTAYLNVANKPVHIFDGPSAAEPYATDGKTARGPLVAPARRQPPLLILDLNGTLVWRPKNQAWAKANLRPARRAYLSTFLDYIFSSETVEGRQRRRWEVLVWSSAQPHNVDSMLRWAGFDLASSSDEQPQTASDDVQGLADAIGQMSVQPSGSRRPLAIWSRANMDLKKGDYHRKVQTFKNLDSVWKKLQWTDPETGIAAAWGPENTLLVDDSNVKAAMQPFNRLPVSTFKGARDDELLALVEVLDGVSRCDNFAALLKRRTRADLGFESAYCAMKAREICRELGIKVDKGVHQGKREREPSATVAASPAEDE